jgi:hypothetical protein
MHPEIAHAHHAMRSEIAEIQLPRRIAFQNDRGEAISLEVASGRVLRVSHPISDHFQASLPDALMNSISQSTKAQVLQLIDILSAFTSKVTKLSVETQILRQNASILDIGVAVEDLFQELDISEQNQPRKMPRNDLEVFIQDCASISSAALLMNGDTILLEHGSEAKLETLKTLALAEFNSSSTHLQIQSDLNPYEQCVIYTGHPQNGQAVLCAIQATNLAFLSFHSNVLEAILDFWGSRNR